MELTANAVQLVSANQNVLFSEVAIPGNCSIIYNREGSGLVILRGITQQCRARFRVTFGANIASPTSTTGASEAATTTPAPVALAISLDGEPILTTKMISTPGATGDYNCVFTSIFLDVPSNCCSQISVKNVGTTSVNVQNANIIIERVA
jgi:hypothetical protein